MTDDLVQRFVVPVELVVSFTERVFDAGNPTLVRALARREPARRHRVLLAVERALVEAHPGLLADSRRYVAAHGDRVELAGEPLVLPGGEACKNDPAAPERVHERLDALGIDRQAFVVIVGGGAFLDMVGYAAATAHRGVRIVRVPTTVLSQADSGVGVKNGVNRYGKKNFAGTFTPPFAVINDASLLGTLPRRDGLAGIAEAVKVALIRDAAFVAWLQDHADALSRCEPAAVARLIRRSADLHLAHIATGGDPFETGSVRPLDFGHWAAHKLEILTAHELRHGEAVAIGIALDTIYASEVGLAPAAVRDAVLTLLERIGLPTWDDALRLPDPSGAPRVLEGLAEFREHLGGELTVTMLRDLGVSVDVHEIDRAAMVRAIARLDARRGARQPGMRADAAPPPPDLGAPTG